MATVRLNRGFQLLLAALAAVSLLTISTLDSRLVAAAYNNLGCVAFTHATIEAAPRQLEMAEDRFLHAIRWAPSLSQALRNRGRVYLVKGEFNNAVEVLRQSIKYEPLNRMGYLELGNAQLSGGNRIDALHTWRLGHVRPTYFWGVGEQYYRKGDIDQALVYYRLANEIDPDYAKAYLGLGRCYQAIGALDDAVAAFETAVELDPTDCDMHFALADALRQRKRDGDWSEATIHFREAIGHGYQSILAYIDLGSLLEGLGRDDEALAVLKEATERWPHRGLSLEAMGRIYRKKGNLDLAKSFLQSAVDKEPSYAPTHFQLALVYSQLGALDLAIRHYEEAVRLRPTIPSYRLSLADAYMSAGDAARAVAEYRQVLALDPDNDAARRALESMEGVNR